MLQTAAATNTTGIQALFQLFLPGLPVLGKGAVATPASGFHAALRAEVGGTLSFVSSRIARAPQAADRSHQDGSKAAIPTASGIVSERTTAASHGGANILDARGLSTPSRKTPPPEQAAAHLSVRPLEAAGALPSWRKAQKAQPQTKGEVPSEANVPLRSQASPRETSPSAEPGAQHADRILRAPVAEVRSSPPSSEASAASPVPAEPSNHTLQQPEADVNETTQQSMPNVSEPRHPHAIAVNLISPPFSQASKPASLTPPQRSAQDLARAVVEVEAPPAAPVQTAAGTDAANPALQVDPNLALNPSTLVSATRNHPAQRGTRRIAESKTEPCFAAQKHATASDQKIDLPAPASILQADAQPHAGLSEAKGQPHLVTPPEQSTGVHFGAGPALATPMNSERAVDVAAAIKPVQAHGYTSTSADTADASLPAQTLVATPRVLEIGIATGSHGWLRVRAELSRSGEVATSLTTASPDGLQRLHKDVAGIAAYLADERIVVSSLSVQNATRTYGFASGAETSSTAGASTGERRGDHPAQDRAVTKSAYPLNQRAGDTSGRLDPTDLAAALFAPATGGWLSVRV